MITQARLDAARARSVANMGDTVTINRPGSGAVDPSTLQWTDSNTTIYSGPAWVNSRPAMPQAANEAEIVQAETVFEVGVPFDTARPLPNDVVTVTASMFTPDLVDMRLRVRSTSADSTATALTVTCEQIARAR